MVRLPPLAPAFAVLAQAPVMAGHTRWVRRSATLVCILGLAALGAGWLAIGAAGDDAPVRRSAAAAKPAAAKPAAPKPAATSKLPPLPTKLRPRVVQPEAGAGSEPEPEVVEDSGLDEPAPKPRQAVS